jgi:hypothetical protein
MVDPVCVIYGHCIIMCFVHASATMSQLKIMFKIPNHLMRNLSVWCRGVSFLTPLVAIPVEAANLDLYVFI